RKRPGGAVGSRPARKRSRLLPSSAGGTSQTEPRDLEESGAPAFGPDLTGESSEPEVIVISDDESPVVSMNGQERRNVTLNSQEQVDGSANGTGANDASVADSAPAEQGAEEEDTESSDAQQGVVIRCPICMEFYSQFVRRGRQLMSTLCGHVFCSRCLPIALEASHMCPTCRVELSPELYHPVYL
ncbi:RNF4 ligase, partial [Nesospiza acunhae]|nr:RNF4 ligase [Nesospiza acunhae]